MTSSGLQAKTVATRQVPTQVEGTAICAVQLPSVPLPEVRFRAWAVRAGTSEPTLGSAGVVRVSMMNAPALPGCPPSFSVQDGDSATALVSRIDTVTVAGVRPDAATVVALTLSEAIVGTVPAAAAGVAEPTATGTAHASSRPAPASATFMVTFRIRALTRPR
ncbi:MAG: hypothetical protein IPK24_21865 [Kineosporiaceae bacterium]|nr:hypothetical protein [Kineosporiaceae bacterium]